MKSFVTVAAAAFVLAVAGRAAADVGVVESITGSPGDWTYTYTLTNDDPAPIYNWAVWFASDPGAETSVTTDSGNWFATPATKGYFPQQYINEGHIGHVYDSTADPFHAGTPNPLAGPNGEPGYYGAYANDYMTGNAGKYWDEGMWKDLPDTEPYWTSPSDYDPLWDKFWRGAKYGYDFGWTEGSGGNVQTSYGIASGGTSQLIVQTSSLIPGQKSFSFNTTDYYYSIPDGGNDSLYVDFEASGTVVPVPGAALLGAMGLGMVVWLKRRGSRKREA